MGAEDRLIWHFNMLGRYTTKSGYHVTKEIRDLVRSAGDGVKALDPLLRG